MNKMKPIFCISIVVSISAYAFAGVAHTLRSPSSRDFNVREFGAKGDGVAKDTAALQASIDAATAAGGGRVVLSGGTFLTGAIALKTGDGFSFGLEGSRRARCRSARELDAAGAPV